MRLGGAVLERGGRTRGQFEAGLQSVDYFIGEEADDLFVLMQEAAFMSLEAFFTFWDMINMPNSC